MIYAFLFLVSLTITYVLKRYAIVLHLIDVPNDRSSHTVPTPRGGGVAIVITFFGALFTFHSAIPSSLLGALCAALPVAIVGFIDDLYPLRASIRLAVQGLSAALALYFLGGIDTLDFNVFQIQGIWINLIAFLAILWLTNLYNFLDGLDGYASSQAVFVCIGAFLVFGGDPYLWLVFAVGGFLVFNLPKASVFMGDVGSTTLGFIFAVLMLHDASTSHFVGWLSLLSLFWFDATLTLFRRWKRGENLSTAHKKHMYQRLHQSGFTHTQVLAAGMILNLLILAALLFIPVERHLYVLAGTIMLLFFYSEFIDSRKGFE